MQYCFSSDQEIHPFRSENVEPFRCFSPLWLLLGSMNEEQRLFTHVMWIQNFIMNIIIKNRQKSKSKLFIIIYILAFLSKLVHPLRVQTKVRIGLTILVLQLLNLCPYCTVTIECKESINNHKWVSNYIISKIYVTVKFCSPPPILEVDFRLSAIAFSDDLLQFLAGDYIFTHNNIQRTNNVCNQDG